VQQFALTPEFFCDVRPDRDRVVVRVAGELDMAAAPAVAAAVDELLGARFARVVIDLSDLSFLDSAGVHMLVSVHHAAAERTCELSLVRGPRNVQRVFELTGADSMFAFDGERVGA
jgi:anti-sigma B factor antagonist